jgi:hypothetical protein
MSAPYSEPHGVKSKSTQHATKYGPPLELSGQSTPAIGRIAANQSVLTTDPTSELVNVRLIIGRKRLAKAVNRSKISTSLLRKAEQNACINDANTHTYAADRGAGEH